MGLASNFGTRARPMANYLQPCRIPRAAYHNIPTNKTAPHQDYDPMPAWAGSFIATKGVRRLLHDKLAKGLSAPKPWMADIYPPGWLVHHTINLHIVKYLSVHFQCPQRPVTATTPAAPDILYGQLIRPAEELYSWVPPNLESGGR
jgi:hypothetical protein